METLPLYKCVYVCISFTRVPICSAFLGHLYAEHVAESYRPHVYRFLQERLMGDAYFCELADIFLSFYSFDLFSYKAEKLHLFSRFPSKLERYISGLYPILYNISISLSILCFIQCTLWLAYTLVLYTII